MDELTPDEKFELGRQMGETMVGMFKIMAKIDGITLQQAIDEWVESYVANRIIQEATGENDADAR